MENKQMLKMYPHPQVNSYLQGFNPYVPKKMFNKLVDKGLNEADKRVCDNFPSDFNRVVSIQPKCFAPHVDLTRAKCAFKLLALPKLKTELGSEDPLTLRQAVTTLGDLIEIPEKLVEAIKIDVPDRLSDLLISEDPYIRERVAIAYTTIANHAKGRNAILKNLSTLNNLWKGLDDRLAAVRLKMARVLVALAQDYRAADRLCILGFMRIITSKLSNERKDILIVYLDILNLLFRRDFKDKVIPNGAFESLIELLVRKTEEILCKILGCLAVLCEDYCGKLKALEIDLLYTLKNLLNDNRESVRIEVVRVISFITVSTGGKLRFLELKMTNPLLCIATQKCCISSELLIALIKILTNVAEAPEGRRILSNYDTLIESVGVGSWEALRRHRQTLLDVIRWRA